MTSLRRDEVGMAAWALALVLAAAATLGWSGVASAQSEGRPTSITQTDTTTFTRPYATNGRTRTCGPNSIFGPAKGITEMPTATNILVPGQ